MSHLPLSLMNRLNKACCFQTSDAVFPKDPFSDYFSFEDLPLSPTYEICSVKMSKLILNTKIINISYYSFVLLYGPIFQMLKYEVMRLFKGKRKRWLYFAQEKKTSYAKNKLRNTCTKEDSPFPQKKN